jgi:O-methyltransferase involved in polyketide biosynthesis
VQAERATAKLTASAILKKKPPKRRPKYAVDDRRQFLTMMSPKTIKAIKLAALDRNEPAWVIMEEAVEEWLERHKAKRSV